MKKTSVLTFAFLFISLTPFCQINASISKECRISTGIGVAGSLRNTKTVGSDLWIQIDYKALEKFSLAMEFENFAYKQNGYYTDLPVYYTNEIKVLNNNFSLLIKYHLPSKGKLKLAFSSGWTYSIRTNTYYIPTTNGTTSNYFPNNNSFSDYRIPLLIESMYPISKTLNILTRLKYNLNPQNGDNYTVGIGLSLKL